MTATTSSAEVWLPGDDLTGLRLHELDCAPIELRATLAIAEEAPRCRIDVLDGVIRIEVVPAEHGRVRVTAIVPTKDAVALWTPGSARGPARIPAAWEPPTTVSALQGMALGCLLGPEDRSVVVYGVDSADQSVDVRAGLVEETAELLLTFEVTAAHPGLPLVAHLDLSGGPFAAVVPAMTGRLSGLRKKPSPADELPVLCTWYFMHQSIDGDALAAYAEPAAGLGFGTLIVDDGWQTADSDRGYGSAGDWTVAPEKILDAGRIVRCFEQQGIRTLWWIGTPFVGHRSAAAGAVPVVADDLRMQAAILDTRSSEARKHLVDRILDLVSSTGSHGVKIDFLERFSNARTRDGSEEGALRLLEELDAGLHATVEAPSVEFREPYFGPASTRRATMMRVNDCPMSPAQNRIGIVDLRLATSGVAVHTDPIMWAHRDSAARVAQHLINGLFGVPQISVDLLDLPRTQRRVLAFWMSIFADYRDVLLHGVFTPTRPDLDYPLLHAHRNGIRITGRYGPVAVPEPTEPWTRWLVANADDPQVPMLESRSGAVRITVRGPDGVVAEVSDRDGLPGAIHVPTGGLVEIERR